MSPNSFPVSVTFKFEYEIQSGEHAEATELHAIGVGFETQELIFFFPMSIFRRVTKQGIKQLINKWA